MHTHIQHYTSIPVVLLLCICAPFDSENSGSDYLPNTYFLLKNINKLISELLTQTSAQYNLPARVQNVFKFSCPFSVPSKPFHITHFGICLGEGTSR